MEEANLSSAILLKADLEDADLKKANLYRADLEDANLSGTNLSGTNLIEAYLYRAKLLNANLSSATLTGACIEDWNINNKTIFENVICDYIYLKGEWNDKEKEYELSKRLPANPEKDFKQREFAKLSEITFETVNLIFNNGIDWKAFLSSYQDIQIKYGDQNVSIQAIENKNDGAFVIRLNVLPGADKGEIESYVKQSYDTKLRVLEAHNHRLLQHNASLENIVNTLASRPIIVEAKAVAESKSMSDTFNNDLKGANITNYANKVEGDQIGTQYNSPQQKTLAEAAAEIQKLLKQLEQDNPNPTEDQQIEHLNDETTPKFKRKVVAALKAASDTAIDEFLDNSYVKVGKAAIMGWIESD